MENKETDAIDYLEGYKEGKQAGIREVVEFLKYNGFFVKGIWYPHEDFSIEWLAKLKEWGIE